MALVMARVIKGLARKTEQDTVLCRNSISFSTWSKGVVITLLLHIFVFSLLLNVELAKAEDMILTGSGIHYPRGFDTNTVDNIRGKAFGIYYPEKGPVQFQLQSQSETFTVLSSPKWYWKDLGEKISDGIEVEVHGSKSLGKDGKLYIIAQEIRIFSSGESLFFRTEDGIPLWSGTLRRKRSLQRQHGSSHRGTGGMKGGTGNMKRGHH